MVLPTQAHPFFPVRTQTSCSSCRLRKEGRSGTSLTLGPWNPVSQNIQSSHNSMSSAGRLIVAPPAGPMAGIGRAGLRNHAFTSAKIHSARSESLHRALSNSASMPYSSGRRHKLTAHPRQRKTPFWTNSISSTRYGLFEKNIAPPKLAHQPAEREPRPRLPTPADPLFIMNRERLSPTQNNRSRARSAAGGRPRLFCRKCGSPTQNQRLRRIVLAAGKAGHSHDDPGGGYRPLHAHVGPATRQHLAGRGAALPRPNLSASNTSSDAFALSEAFVSPSAAEKKTRENRIAHTCTNRQTPKKLNS